MTIERLSVTDEEMQEAIETLEDIMPSEREMAMGDYADIGGALHLAIQALKAYRPTESERVGNSDKLGCKCKQAVCLNGTAYCANCGRKL